MPNRARRDVGPGSDTFLRVLVALTAIIVTGQVLARLFAYLSQPPVIGGVRGVLLGLATGAGGLGARPSPSVAPFMGIIAQLGSSCTCFLSVWNSIHTAQTARTCYRGHFAPSILFPFILAAVLAVFVPAAFNSDVPFTSFALFMGVAM